MAVVVLTSFASINIWFLSEGIPAKPLQTHVNGKLKNFECGTGKRKNIFKVEIEGFNSSIYLDGIPGCKVHVLGSNVELYAYLKTNGNYEASEFRINDKTLISFDRYVERKQESNMGILLITLFMWGCLFYHLRSRNITRP